MAEMGVMAIKTLQVPETGSSTGMKITFYKAYCRDTSMKRILVLLFMAVFLVFSCGCTGASPSSPVPQSATPAPTPIVTMTKPIPPAQQPTQIPVTKEMTHSVSDNTITIMNYQLSPANITVSAGSTVRWVNEDTNTAHRIQFTDKRFPIFLISSGQAFSQKFDSPGVYPYTCVVQMNEQGTVTVV